jgi:hypothetical protein
MAFCLKPILKTKTFASFQSNADMTASGSVAQERTRKDRDCFVLEAKQDCLSEDDV